MRTLAHTVILLSALMSSCVTPTPDQSEDLEVPQPTEWTTEAARLQGAVRADWLDDFDDAVLPSLVAEALASNYDLAVAASRLDAAHARATIAGAGRWPGLSANQDGSRRRRSGTSGFQLTRNISNGFNLGLNLSWELDIWGRLRNAYRAGIGDFQASGADYDGARLSLAAQTAKAWFNAIEAELQVRLAEKMVTSFEANLATIEQRFRKGISRALDLRLTRANVAGARSGLHLRKRRKDGSMRALEIILGRYPSASIELVDALPTLKSGVPAGIHSEVLARRPDLVAAERRLAAATERVEEARKLRLPSIRLTTSAGTSTSEFDMLLNGDFKVWAIGYSLTAPIFQATRLKAGQDRSEADRKGALASYAEAALVAFREVESALAAEVYLAAQERALGTAAEESSGAEKLAWDEYQRGLNTIIMVLESQRRSFDSKRQLLEITNQRLQNRIDLYLALGGGFEGTPRPGDAVSVDGRSEKVKGDNESEPNG